MTNSLPTAVILIGIVGIMWFYNPLFARTAYKDQKKSTPTITVGWGSNTTSTHTLSTKVYKLTSPHLSKDPFFHTYDEPFFYDNLLPDSPIPTRLDPTWCIEPHKLKECMEHLMTEIAQKKKEYQYFDVLTHKDFNRRKKCGLLILKFKEYPFVLKLFIETPKTFINPRCKGFEPVFFFYMGGGINRHLAGFTRPKNLAYIRQKIANDPLWSSIVDLPRKWFWLPQQEYWLDIEGTHISGTPTIRTQIPAIYGVIADVISIDRCFSMRNRHDRQTALALCDYLDLYVDPHIKNFMYEKNTGKLLIVDTEHFPTIVGLKEKIYFSNYTQWYGFLMRKCAKDMLFSSNARLSDLAMQPSALALPSACKSNV